MRSKSSPRLGCHPEVVAAIKESALTKDRCCSKEFVVLRAAKDLRLPFHRFGGNTDACATAVAFSRRMVRQ